ncbi:inositol monophosphatase family protein [Candidatus Woesearchaeota archaeon]|jgi:myo-inositol-1(or 4)-monophosphatase|nr:inositol monophosphatase family protein [Candidatus Woesearchaeota archaeon]
MNLYKELTFAREAILRAETEIRQVRKSGNFDVRFKPDGSPYTKADPLAERLIRDYLLTEFPGDGFEGEELPKIQSTNGRIWRCDPIDGTWSFINFEDTVATALSLHQINPDGSEKVVLALINNLFSAEKLYIAGEGIKTTLDGNQLPDISRDPSKLIVNYNISPNHSSDISEIMKLWTPKGPIVKAVSILGSAAYSLSHIAKGSHDIYVTSLANPFKVWDVAAGIYLIQKTGGVVTNLDGDPITQDETVIVAAKSPEHHAQFLEHITKTEFGKRYQR